MAQLPHQPQGRYNVATLQGTVDPIMQPDRLRLDARGIGRLFQPCWHSIDSMAHGATFTHDRATISRSRRAGSSNWAQIESSSSVPTNSG